MANASHHYLDADGKPAGGTTFGIGFSVSWQHGPIGVEGPDRKEPNGAFVEDVIRASVDRIEFYENAGFGCGENREAVMYLNKSLFALESRTVRRTIAGVEGSHEMAAGDDKAVPATAG